MNEATQLGINAINKARQSVVESKAIELITRIGAFQGLIASEKETIKAHQEQLSKIASDVITQQTVLGVEFTGTLNPNQVTIANAIKKLNEDRQGQVELRGQTHISKITNAQAKVTQYEKDIATLREELSKLAVDVVEPTAVVGQQ